MHGHSHDISLVQTQPLPEKIPSRVSTSATHFKMLLDRQAEWQQRIRMIQQASRFLYISTYYLEYDKYGIQFLDELERALARGVRVTLIIDAFGQILATPLMSKDVRSALHAKFEKMKQQGATIIIYRALRKLQKLLGSGYHIKIQVSEQGEVIFGSSNISKMSFEKWMEFAVALRGPVAAVMLEELLRLINRPNLSDLAHLKRFEQTTDSAEMSNINFDYFSYNPCNDPSIFSPIKQRFKNSLTQALIKAIDLAKKSIKLTSFYYKPEPGLFEAITNAAKRGVEIEIYHSHINGLEATKLTWIAASARYKKLLREGIKIYEHLEGQHTKFVLIDNRQAWLGSYNFEYAADDRMAEAMLMTSDQAVIKIIHQIFIDLKNNPKNIIVPDNFLALLPVWLRIYRFLFLPFKRWF